MPDPDVAAISGDVTTGNGMLITDNNIGGPAVGALLRQPSAQSYVREGFLAGPLEPVDSVGPNADFAGG